MGAKAMTPPSSWPDRPLPLALDASAVINLNGSGRAADILRILGGEVLVASDVIRELRNGIPNRRKDSEKLAVLIDHGLVKEVKLGEPGLILFERLAIGAAASTLEDGEAATIALAFEQEVAAVIDESKGRRLCAVHAPKVRLIGSIELFLHDAVTKDLDKGLAEAIFCALTIGRMHVLPMYDARVAKLLGPERAALCKSLPKSVRR